MMKHPILTTDLYYFVAVQKLLIIKKYHRYFVYIKFDNLYLQKNLVISSYNPPKMSTA